MATSIMRMLPPDYGASAIRKSGKKLDALLIDKSARKGRRERAKGSGSAFD